MEICFGVACVLRHFFSPIRRFSLLVWIDRIFFLRVGFFIISRTCYTIQLVGKIILTSMGFNPKIKSAFLKVVGKPWREIRMVMIPTGATRTAYERKYIKMTENQLRKFGLKELKVLHLDKQKTTFADVKGFDVMYMCGGSTYWLMQQIRKSGFDTVARRFVKKGGTYFGISAGSIVAGINIAITGWGSAGEENDVRLKDLRGISLVPLAIFPHYEPKLKKEVRDFQKTVSYPVVALNNMQALIMRGSSSRII